MVEQRKVQIADGGAQVSKEEKLKFRESQAEFLKQSTLKKQEVVMKFTRSNDAVLKVYTPISFSGQGCISCSADHNVRSKYRQLRESLLKFFSFQSSSTRAREAVVAKSTISRLPSPLRMSCTTSGRTLASWKTWLRTIPSTRMPTRRSYRSKGM